MPNRAVNGTVTLELTEEDCQWLASFLWDHSRRKRHKAHTKRRALEMREQIVEACGWPRHA